MPKTLANVWKWSVLIMVSSDKVDGTLLTLDTDIILSLRIKFHMGSGYQ